MGIFTNSVQLSEYKHDTNAEVRVPPDFRILFPSREQRSFFPLILFLLQ